MLPAASTRECKDLDILLYVSAGQPVIEATSGVRLGCFAYNYFGLAEQFAAAGLDPWYSEWSNVHDFTAERGRESWTYIQPATIHGSELLPPLEQAREGLAQLAGFVTPQTWGNRPSPLGDAPRILVMLAPGSHDAGFELIDQTLASRLQQQQAILIRTRVVDLSRSKDKLSAVLIGEARKAQSGFAALAAAKGGVLGFEIQVVPAQLNDVTADLRALQQRIGGAKMYISGTTAAESKGPLQAFFENAPIM